MTLEQLEHLLRAAGDICEESAFFVIGSQAVLGQFPNAPESLLESSEADLIPVSRADRTDLIDGTIGELSPFHETYGYYAQGVGEETAILPLGWRDRVIEIRNPNTRDVSGLCLEIHDLIVAKLAAGRGKDMLFARETAKHGMIYANILRERLQTLAVSESHRSTIADRITAAFRFT